MTTYQHKCLKCREPYTDTDQDDFYCEKCNAVRKEIAKEVDKKMANRVSTRETKSELQIFNELAKRGGAKNNFVKISDLGIKL